MMSMKDARNIHKRAMKRGQRSIEEGEFLLGRARTPAEIGRAMNLRDAGVDLQRASTALFQARLLMHLQRRYKRSVTLASKIFGHTEEQLRGGLCYLMDYVSKSQMRKARKKANLQSKVNNLE